jgi:hypothetical protein
LFSSLAVLRNKPLFERWRALPAVASGEVSERSLQVVRNHEEKKSVKGKHAVKVNKKQERAATTGRGEAQTETN